MVKLHVNTNFFTNLFEKNFFSLFFILFTCKHVIEGICFAEILCNFTLGRLTCVNCGVLYAFIYIKLISVVIILLHKED